MGSPSSTEQVRALTDALEGLSPRSQQVLTWILLENLPVATAAARLGVDTSALAIHALRAAFELSDPAKPQAVLPREIEEALAAELVQAFDRRAPPVAPALQRLWPTLVRLRELSPQVLQERDERLRREEESPAAARREWLRKLAIVVILLASLYLYFHQSRR